MKPLKLGTRRGLGSGPLERMDSWLLLGHELCWLRLSSSGRSAFALGPESSFSTPLIRRAQERKRSRGFMNTAAARVS